MTPQIALTMAILVLAVFLFVTERLRADLVALLVLVSLVIAGLVTPAEALSGFSNPAVVTVWAVFILSAALAGTGVANEIGRPLTFQDKKINQLKNAMDHLINVFAGRVKAMKLGIGRLPLLK